MRKLSSYATKAFDDTLDIVAQTGREGWDEIAGRRVLIMFLMFTHQVKFKEQ